MSKLKTIQRNYGSIAEALITLIADEGMDEKEAAEILDITPESLKKYIQKYPRLQQVIELERNLKTRIKEYQKVLTEEEEEV